MIDFGGNPIIYVEGSVKVISSFEPIGLSRNF